MNKDNEVELLLNSMDLRQKIGQMMLVGFPEPFNGSLPDGIVEMIDKFKVGGVGIMARNTKTPAMMRKMNEALQDVAESGGSPPLLLMADQEGGVVMQATEKATLFPGQMACGAVGSMELAYESARIMGVEGLALGLNLFCAPVLDVNIDPDNEIIGIRSLGEEPAVVSALGTAMLHGYEKSGVIACAKHFPGHGSTKSDSHSYLPVLSSTPEELEDRDLAPFYGAIAADVPVIMTAHICYPVLAPDGSPATLSPEILTGLLRRRMGFKGVIITDCLEMKAIQNYYGTIPAAVAAVKAGADIVLICHTPVLQKGAMEAIYDFVKMGEIPESRIDQSVRRILDLKLNRLKDTTRDKTNGKNLLDSVGSPAHLLVEQRMAREAVTLLRNREGILPLKPGHTGGIALIYPETMPILRKEDLEDSANMLVEAFRARCQALVEVKFHIPPTPEEITNAVTVGEKADVIVVLTSSKTCHQEQAQGKLVHQLLQTGKPVVTVAMRNPYDLRAYPEVKTHLVTYGYRPCSIAALVEVLFGEIKPSGKLPVSIPGLCRKGDGLKGYKSGCFI